MGTLALLVEDTLEPFGLDADTASRLAELGVSRVSLLRDGAATAMVLEGWAFDPDASASEAEAAVLGRAGRARLLHVVAQLSLAPAR